MTIDWSERERERERGPYFSLTTKNLFMKTLRVTAFPSRLRQQGHESLLGVFLLVLQGEGVSFPSLVYIHLLLQSNLCCTKYFHAKFNWNIKEMGVYRVLSEN